MRRKRLEDPVGKINAILAAVQLLNDKRSSRGIRVLELGCGEGHLLDALLNICKHSASVQEYVGVDNRSDVIKRARRLYPAILFLEADYTTNSILDLGKFSIVMLVNTLHEVYSSSYDFALVEIDKFVGKRLIKSTLATAAQQVELDGHLVLFDGVEPSLDADRRVILRFRYDDALNEFRSFADEYEAFHITYRELETCNRIEISVRDFTRYITKTIFLGTPLWKIERQESYQYYNEAEFRANLTELGFEITDLRYLSPSHQHWQSRVVIETPGVDFPNEHILIVAKRKAKDPGKVPT